MPPPRTTARPAFGRQVAAVCAALLGITLLVTLPGSDPARAATQDASPYGVLALRSGDVAVTPQLTEGTPGQVGAGSLGYVVLNAWEHARIPAIRAAWPGVKVLVYKDAAATVAYAATTGPDGKRRDNALLPAGVGYNWALANAPSWFLRDGSGQAIEWADYRGVWPMDVGNADYQRTWLANVRSELQANGWDGVMLDDTLSYLSHPTVGGVTSTAIPDDAAMRRSMGSFLDTVGTGLRSAGFLAVPNVTLHWRTWREVITAWTPSVSGWLVEYFVKWGLGPTNARMGGSDWASRLDIVELAQSLGGFALPVTYGGAGDRVLQTYHRASWLLAWNGRAGASIYVPSETDSTHLPQAPRWTLGAPQAARYPLNGGSVWRRDYSGGTVLVNTSQSAQTVALGAAYVTDDGVLVDRVTLPPVSGAVLRSSGVDAPGLPAPEVSVALAPVPASPAKAAPAADRSTTNKKAKAKAKAKAVRTGKAFKAGRSGRGVSATRLRLKVSDRRVGCADSVVRC